VEEGFDAVIQDYIDFINRQHGMYIDALAGFGENHREIEHQVAIISKPIGWRLDDVGRPVMMRASVEDPTRPDVIHQRIIRAADYLAANATGGSNEQQHAQAVLVFLYTYWELETRPRLAAAKGCEVSEIKANIMGELRILRNVVLHSKGIVRADTLKGMKKLGAWFTVDQPIHISFENMKQIFIWINQGCALLLFEWLGVKDAQTQAEQIVSLAIQNVRRTKPSAS
jgi:hypothetical protein